MELIQQNLVALLNTFVLSFMSVVKTYKKVNKEDDSISFSITRMEEIYEKHSGEPDEPHRHDYYTSVFTEEATGTHYVDFKAYELKAKQLYFISPGQVHQIIEKKKSKGYALTFSDDFLLLNNIALSFIGDLNLFNDFSESPPLHPDEETYTKIKSYLDEMYAINNSEMNHKNEAIGALLKLILILCNNACNLPVISDISGNNTLRNFKQLINQHYIEWHNTSAYANELNITPDHLNKVVKAQSGKSAKEHIQSRIIVAAKRLLHFTEMSNKEIGYELGFTEPSHFSAFFKKCVGLSPTKFRTKS